jgi:hypothetical protein
VEDMGSFVAGRDQQQSIFKKKSNKLRIDDAGKRSYSHPDTCP